MCRIEILMNDPIFSGFLIKKDTLGIWKLTGRYAILTTILGKQRIHPQKTGDGIDNKERGDPQIEGKYLAVNPLLCRGRGTGKRETHGAPERACG